MIFDRLSNCEKFYGVNKNFEKAFEFIKRAVLEDLSAGRYDIQDKDIYAFVQEYDTDPDGIYFFEGHKKYIDIQCIISGIEAIESLHISKTKPKAAYDAEKDITFYENTDNAGKLILESGEYAVFFRMMYISPA